MKRMTASCLFVACFALFGFSNQPRPGDDSKGGIEICLTSGVPKDLDHETLTFPWLTSVKYDPANPDYSFSLLLHNGSQRVLSLPSQYDGKDILIYGCSQTEHRKLWLYPSSRNKEQSPPLKINPGKTVVLFNGAMKDLFSDEPKPETKKADRLVWVWNARPGAPPSPLHQRDGKLAEGAIFWAEVVVDKYKLRSEPMIVTTKD